MQASFSGRVASVPSKSVDITKAKKVRGCKINAVAAPAALDTRQSERVSFAVLVAGFCQYFTENEYQNFRCLVLHCFV